MSFFSRVDYNYSGKYFWKPVFVPMAHRRFGENNRFGYFLQWGWPGGYREESFLQNVSWLSDLKLQGQPRIDR